MDAVVQAVDVHDPALQGVVVVRQLQTLDAPVVKAGPAGHAGIAGARVIPAGPDRLGVGHGGLQHGLGDIHALHDLTGGSIALLRERGAAPGWEEPAGREKYEHAHSCGGTERGRPWAGELHGAYLLRLGQADSSYPYND